MNTQKVLVIILIIVAVGLLARFVVFKDQFDKWGEGLQRIGSWQDSYKAQHPEATNAEVDAAFNESMTKLKVWQDNYKKEHPEATNAEMEAAFNAQWHQ